MTRYEAAKLYLLGKTAAELQAECQGVLNVFTVRARLHHMAQLSAGVLPWAVTQHLTAAYTDLAEPVRQADAARVADCLAWLEERILPQWDVRATL